MVVAISSRAALLCVAALTAWCFALADGAVPPARQPIRRRSSRSAGGRPIEYSCGREVRPDRHLCTYEERVRMITAGEISPLPKYPEDPSISSAVQWFNVSSDQIPMSLAASAASDGSIFVVRGSLRNSRSPGGFAQVSSAPGSAELLRLSATNGAVSARFSLVSLGNPQRLAVDAKGNLWIVNRMSAEVVKLSGSDYSRVLSIGGPPGQTANGTSLQGFCLPIDVAAATAADGSGRIGDFIYIADSSSQAAVAVAPKRDHCLGDGGRLRPSRIFRFAASNGAYVDSFDLPPEVVSPVRLSVDRRLDRIYVADSESGRIYVYGAGLRTATSGGGIEPFGHRHRNEIVIDGKVVDLKAHPTRDQLYVVAIVGAGNRTERFTFGFTVNVSQPAMIARWTPPSQPYGFYWFYGLAIDSSGCAIYGADDDGATTRLWKFNIL